LAPDLAARLSSEAGEVFLKRRDCVAVAVNEQAGGRAARKCFEAESAGAREQVRHCETFEAAEPALKHRE
jgi:hypothetical protein